MKHYKSRVSVFLIALLISTVSFSMTGLTDLQGNVATYNDRYSNGRWLVVMIWAHDCHICNREVKQYEALSLKGDELNLEVIGVSLDGPDGIDDARQFVSRHDLTFDNFVGDVNSIALHYLQATGGPLAGTPGFLVYGPDGVLRAHQVGAVPAIMMEKFVTQGHAGR